MDLNEALKDLHGLVEDRDGLVTNIFELEKILKQEKAALKLLEETVIPEAMDEMGLEEFKDTKGRKVQSIKKIRASITKANMMEAYAWLREHDYGHIIKKVEKESVHPGTLGAFAREMMEEGEELPDCITIYEQRSVKVTS